jgi:Transcriptional regulators
MTSQQGGERQPAGIRDVAKLAGVSVASVSFALNGQPGVADDTRRRILAAAAQLGYRANPQAQALRGAAPPPTAWSSATSAIPSSSRC